MPILWGEPGTQWTNTTGQAWWQLNCTFVRSCVRCIRLHRAIAPSWNLPLHDYCRCWVTAIPPGDSAEEFANFQQEMLALPPARREAAVGRSAFRLTVAGLITWDDVVAADRVRTLVEIVARRGLTVDQMVKAGVSRRIAQDAWDQAQGLSEQDVLARVRQGLEDALAQASGAGWLALMHIDTVATAPLAGTGRGKMLFGPGAATPDKPGPEELGRIYRRLGVDPKKAEEANEGKP